MMSIDALRSDWTALSPDKQTSHWQSFLADLDAGAAGFHRYYRVLMPLWDAGDVPDHVDEERRMLDEVEMRADALWALQHPSFDDSCQTHSINALYAAVAELSLEDLPY